MIEIVQDFYLVEECIEEVLSVIKPTEDDRNKRLETIQEFVNSIYSAADLEGSFSLFGHHKVLFHNLKTKSW